MVAGGKVPISPFFPLKNKENQGHDLKFNILRDLIICFLTGR